MTYAETARWLRGRLWIGVVAGAIMWVAWIGSLAYGGWTRDAENQLSTADHIAFYTAAKLVREGRQADIYDHEVVGRTQQELTGGDWRFLMAFRNPPFYALLYLPTAGLSFPLSGLIWTLIGFAAYAVTIWCLRPRRPWWVTGWAFTFYPFFAAVSFGQNTLLSMVAFAGVYRLMADRRPFAAGLVGGLLWYKPQLLIGLFIWWGLTPRRNFACWLGVAVMGATLAAVSWIVLPEASWAFVETLRGNVGYGGENGWIKHSPRGFFTLLLPGQTALAWALTIATSLAAIGVTAWVVRRTGAPLAVMFPIAVFLSLWASPHVMIYEWALAVPAAIVLWERLPARRDVWLCLFSLGWLAMEISTVVARMQIEGPRVHTSFLRFELPPAPVAVQLSVPVLGLIGWLTARELTRRLDTAQPAVGKG